MVCEARAARGADSHLLGVGSAALVVIEVDDETEGPNVAHLRPEGVGTFRASGQHAGSVDPWARPVMARKVQFGARLCRTSEKPTSTHPRE